MSLYKTNSLSSRPYRPLKETIWKDKSRLLKLNHFLNSLPEKKEPQKKRKLLVQKKFQKNFKLMIKNHPKKERNRKDLKKQKKVRARPPEKDIWEQIKLATNRNTMTIKAFMLVTSLSKLLKWNWADILRNSETSKMSGSLRTETPRKPKVLGMLSLKI